MSEFYPVSRERHGNKAWRKMVLPATARSDQVVVLVARELISTQNWTACAFIKSGDEFAPVALCGLEKGQNLFVDTQGNWSGRTLPAHYANYPFKLGKFGNEELALCIDEASGVVVDAGQGERFFTDEGQPGQAAQDKLRDLLRYRQEREQTRNQCRQLNDAGLLVPWPLKVQHTDGLRTQEGLFQIDEGALNEVPAKTLVALRDSGALLLAYCQLLSMQNIALLSQLAQKRGHFRAKTELAADLGNMFNTDNGTLSFDNL